MPAVAMALLLGEASGAQPSFERRGNAVEARRRALQERIASLRASIRDTLQASAPDLLARLDPAPPPIPQGYGLLPRIVTDGPQSADSTYILSVYSWPWTDTLIARTSRRAAKLAAATGRPDYARVVDEFNAIVADRRLVDSHAEHNWQWQRAIAADPAHFARVTTTIDSAVAGRTVATLPAPAMPRIEVSLDESVPDTIVLRVPMVTDIRDTAFVRAFRNAVESRWKTAGHPAYRVTIDFRFADVGDLYCAAAAAACSPPAAGSTIDVAAHIARFPAGFAVLTTGATQPQVIGGRALVLGPRDVTPRTLAHEFGHLLGFDDAYLRGQRDLGPDGFAIVELVPNRLDVMASPGYGSVLPRHFRQLEPNLRAGVAMRAGLAALYDRHDPHAAAGLFRETLRLRPDHYGATFQLAKALDQGGDSVTATVVWKRMLELATAQHDEATVKTVRSRLGLP
jgi:hypothetical protein